MAGLACFFAWTYGSFFSGALMPTVSSLEAEYAWIFAWIGIGAGIAVAAATAMAVSAGASQRSARILPFVAGLFAAAGSALAWTGLSLSPSNEALAVAGGTLAGAGMSLLALCWGRLLSRYNTAQVERTVLAAFAVSVPAWLALLFVQGLLLLAGTVALPLASAYLSIRAARLKQCEEPASFTRQRGTRKRAFIQIASLLVLLLLLWIQLSYFRVLAFPSGGGDRLSSYLFPFVCATAATAVGLFACVTRSRFVNFTLAYRWALPLMVLGYGLLFVDYGEFNRSLAYTINLIAMLGVELGCWMAAAKSVGRTDIPPYVLFCGLGIAEGAGVAIGSALGTTVVGNDWCGQVSGMSFMLLAAVFAVAMIAGFNPRWLSLRLDSDEEDLALLETHESGASATSPAPETADIRDLFQDEARRLRDSFGLTARETEIVALLLAGRTRPYIRDELTISLNTVNAHARSIYQKCEVHSLQEIIDLLRPAVEDA